MKIYYKILKDKQLLILKFQGEWCMNDYISAIHKTLKDPDFETINKVLSDLRDISTNSDINQVDELVKLREKTIQKRYKHVRIITDPTNTAIAHLYKEELNKLGFIDNYCSTVEHAVKLLDLDLEVRYIESILKKIGQ